jgi:hypothetical protein
MTKPQKLRMTAEGLMAGLVACGYRGPWHWSHSDWELAFYKAWGSWPPRDRTPELFPRFEIGGSGRTSQARDALATQRDIPVHNYDSQQLPEKPMGLSPQKYLEIWVDAARPDEWINLARAFLSEMKDGASAHVAN